MCVYVCVRVCERVREREMMLSSKACMRRRGERERRNDTAQVTV